MREDSEGKTDMRNMVKDLNLRAEGLRLQQTRAVGQIFVPDFSCSSHSAPPRKNPGVGVCSGVGWGGLEVLLSMPIIGQMTAGAPDL